METTSVVSVSLATNGVVLAVFGLVRWQWPAKTPDVGALLRQGSHYSTAHLPYLLAWAMLMLACSAVIAVTAARAKGPRRLLTRLLAPVIKDSSAWCEVFAAGADAYPHAGLELADGGFVSGRVVWFSTHLEESGDRDLVLGPPLVIRSAEGVQNLDVQRVIVPAREIRRIDVTYIIDAKEDS